MGFAFPGDNAAEALNWPLVSISSSSLPFRWPYDVIHIKCWKQCFVTWQFFLRWGIVSTTPKPPSWKTTPCRLSASNYSMYSQQQSLSIPGGNFPISNRRSCNLHTEGLTTSGLHDLAWSRTGQLKWCISRCPCLSTMFLRRNISVKFAIPVVARRGSAVSRLLGLRVRIPLGSSMTGSCECCVLLGRGLCVGLITRTEES